MPQRSVQFRRWDHALAALFFAALFTVSLFNEVSREAWDAVGPPLVALVIAIMMFRRRPGVILQPDHLVVFSDWYRKEVYAYEEIAHVTVTEGAWTNPVQLVLNDGRKRNLPMLGLGRRPNAFERKMIDALTDIVPVQWRTQAG